MPPDVRIDALLPSDAAARPEITFNAVVVVPCVIETALSDAVFAIKFESSSRKIIVFAVIASVASLSVVFTSLVRILHVSNVSVTAVSYTHLTLPTTPYV